MTLPIVLTFAALLVVTALALLWSRWPAWTKGLLVLGVTAFYFSLLMRCRVCGDGRRWKVCRNDSCWLLP